MKSKDITSSAESSSAWVLVGSVPIGSLIRLSVSGAESYASSVIAGGYSRGGGLSQPQKLEENGKNRKWRYLWGLARLCRLCGKQSFVSAGDNVRPGAKLRPASRLTTLHVVNVGKELTQALAREQRLPRPRDLHPMQPPRSVLHSRYAPAAPLNRTREA